MAPIVDSSWPRMGSDMENPFQNVPGRFILALPNLRSSLSFGPSTCGIPLTPSPRHSPPEGQVAPFLCDESSFDRDGGADTTPGESQPQQGEAKSELASSDSNSTHTPSPSSPTSSTSSEKGHTTEKIKRSRRRRRRNRPVVDLDGCVMGPRMFLFRPFWAPEIVPSSPWSPGKDVVFAPGRDAWFEPQTVPGC